MLAGDQSQKVNTSSFFHKFRSLMAFVNNPASPICGIGVGSENCYVAITRQGGVEILLNEYSQRSTPAYIAFGGNQREIGVAAKQKQLMNLDNTCLSPTSIIGKKFHQLNLATIPYKVEQGENDEIVVRVMHNGSEQLFSPVQILAMLYTKLRQIAGNSLSCVINCPNYFDYIQRKAIINAANIAGLNPLRVTSDMTAVALYYGLYRSSPTNSDISVVGFVDCGENSSQASVVLFNHKESYMKVLSSEFSIDVGGRQFNEILANYFIEKHNLKLNKRARYRLVAECEKLKKNLSANPNELPINIECLYEEKDFSSRIDREKFEEISKELFDKIALMLKATYQKAIEAYDKEFRELYGDFQLQSVEIVGGTSRIPAIKRMIKDYCGLNPSTTLNADEAVTRGCTLQSAILSPVFRVARELHIIDLLSYNLDFKYEIPGKDLKIISDIFPRGHPFPYTKQITINSHILPITVGLDYQNINKEQVCLAQYEINEMPGSNAMQYILEHRCPIKMRVRIDANGLASIGTATISYEVPEKKVEPLENSSENQASMETDQAAIPPSENSSQQQLQQQQENHEQQQVKRKKPKMMTIDLEVKPIFLAGELPKNVKDLYTEIESNLVLADKNWKEKTDARNALEEFVYEWRERLDSSEYQQFIDEAMKQEFKKDLENNEKWLYEQDENEILHSKTVYNQRTESMTNNYANGIIYRKREYENFPSYLEQLGHHIQQGMKLIETAEPDEKEEIEKLLVDIKGKQSYLDQVSGKVASLQTFYENLPFSCNDICQQATQLQSSITGIQQQRKRRAEEKQKAAELEKQKAAELDKKKREQEQAKQQQKHQEASGDGHKPDSGKMDVDSEFG